MYDVIVIGAGPAGLAAGLYASRARLKTLILEREKAGGQIVLRMMLKTIRVQLKMLQVQA